MTATVVATQGTSITMKIGTGTAVAVAGFTNFSGIGGGSPTIIDTSDLGSQFKTKTVGLPDEGQAKLSFNLIDADPGQVAMRNARAARSLVTLDIVLSNADKYELNGYVLTWEEQGGTDKIVTVSSTFEITGAVTFTPHP